MKTKRMTPTHTASLAPIIRTGKHDGTYNELVDFARDQADRAGCSYLGRHAYDAGVASEECRSIA